jgi:hypothetical protein
MGSMSDPLQVGPGGATVVVTVEAEVMVERMMVEVATVDVGAETVTVLVEVGVTVLRIIVSHEPLGRAACCDMLTK